MNKTRVVDTIVYTVVSNGGGVDGLDHSDKGGQVTNAFLTREEVEKCANLPWGKVVPIVMDLEKTAKDALDKLDPVTRLAVTHYHRATMVALHRNT